MNKIAKMMCLMALVALLGVSCKKQEERQTFTASLGTGEWTIDYADIDGGEKLYLTPEKKLWFEAGDQVVVANIDAEDPGNSGWSRFEARESAQYTTFQAIGTPDPLLQGKKDGFFAYYPGNEGMVDFSWDPAHPGYGTSGEQYNHELYPNYGHFVLDSMQAFRKIANVTAIPEKALYAAAKDESASKWQDCNFEFSMIGGLLDLSFYNPKTTYDTMYVTKVVVNDPERNLAGHVYMRVDRVDPAYLQNLILYYDTDNPGYMNQMNQYISYVGYRVPGVHEGNNLLTHSLTLNCVTSEYPNGVLLPTTKADAEHFVFGVRPAAFFKGLNIEVYFKDKNGVEHHYHNGTTVNNMIKPSHRLVFSPLKIKDAYIDND